MGSFSSKVLLPALRAKMGDRWYYVTTLTLEQVAQSIKPVDSIHERKELKTWIQRKLRFERKEAIANYLLNEEQRFFNSVVAGIYGGDPEWFPLEVGKSSALRGINLLERQATAFGFLRLSGTEDIFAIDGQHRVEGIREALLHSDALKEDELTVIFVAHKSTDKGRERTRRLFTTLNKYAKPVSQAELIALNDDDTFAIVTRQLIESYPGLRSEFVPLAPTANIPKGNHTCITTVIALYDLVKTISVHANSRGERRMLENGPPTRKKVDEVYELATLFWDSLKREILPIRNVLQSAPQSNLASKYRTENGGHLLFRPAGLQGFARAVRVMIDNGERIQGAVDTLAGVSLQLTDKPWDGVLWNPIAKTMIVKHKRLVPNLFLYMVGHKLSPKNYDLLTQYRKATGLATARLPHKII